MTIIHPRNENRTHNRRAYCRVPRRLSCVVYNQINHRVYKMSVPTDIKFNTNTEKNLIILSISQFINNKNSLYLAFTPVVLISVFFRLSSDRTKLKYIDFEHCKLKFILWKATCQSQYYLFE